MQKIRTFVGHNNLPIVADCYGDETAKTVVLFGHGGGQTRHSWKSTALELSKRDCYTISMDLRGHGDSGWAKDEDYSLEAYAKDYQAVCATLDRRPVLVGASLGGLSAMIAGGELNPRLFSAVIFVDIAPTMADEGVDKIRAFMGADLETGFANLEEAADAIAKYLPNRPRPKNLKGLSKNLRLHDDGRYRWHWDPKFMSGGSRSVDARNPERLKNATRAIEAPLMLVRGKQSELVTEQSVAEFLALVPSAKFVDVSNAGHMVAGDNNDVFSAAIFDFIEQN